MMFFFKRKKIHLDCFTQYGVIANDSPIAKTSEFIPEWWRKLPLTVPATNEYGVELQNPTMRSCIGFTELYRLGVTIPLWSDLNIRIASDNYSYQYKMPNNSISDHPPIQHGFTYKNFIHIKITNPWFFKEKTGVSFLCVENPWEKLLHHPKMQIMSGVLNFDYQHSCHINAFFTKESQPYQYNLETGLPLMQLVPLSDNQIEPHVHVVDDAEYLRIARDHTPNKFTFWGYKHKKKFSIRKKY